MEERRCVVCGKLFIPKASRRSMCYDDHYMNCSWCGKRYLETNLRKLTGLERGFCSKECAKQSGAKGLHYTLKCAVCGKEFKSNSKFTQMCPDKHWRRCEVCGKLFELTDMRMFREVKTCSRKCSGQLARMTYNERYTEEEKAAFLAKQEATVLARYGAKNVLCSNSSIRYKVDEGMIAKYGVAHAGQSSEIMARREETCLERYGVRHALQNEEVKEKGRQTCMSKYGTDNYAKSIAFHAQSILDPSKAEQATELNNDPVAFLDKYFPDTQPTLQDIANVCGIRDSSVGYIIMTHNCQDRVGMAYSYMEQDVYSFLVNLLPDAEIQRNTFQVIAPYEVDIYLPEYNLAIECDPTWTHNSSCAIYSDQGEKPKDKNYHKMKTDMCEQKGIFLLHIFGYDWTQKRDIIESMISNLVSKTQTRIGGRKTEIKEVSFRESVEFLNANHRQGAAQSKIRLGLYYNDELVSLMTFSHMRNTIGKVDGLDENTYELVRFCNKINTSVIGGASKLLNYFIAKYDPSEIRSFSDRAHTKGKLYEQLGFKYDHESDPGYMWVKLKTDEAYARSNAQKQNIAKFLGHEVDLSKTEFQLMEEDGYVAVYDSGVILWKWRKDDEKTNSSAPVIHHDVK